MKIYFHIKKQWILLNFLTAKNNFQNKKKSIKRNKAKRKKVKLLVEKYNNFINFYVSYYFYLFICHKKS